jgi:hypothetical protein
MSARDLTAWCSWLAAGYPLGATDDDVLAASSRREMQMVHQLDPPRMRGPVRTAGYGYGLEVELYDVGIIVSHRGGYPGFSAQMAWHPDTQIGVLIVENGPYARTPAVTALQGVLAEVSVSAPVLWPTTLRARDDIEQLLCRWDDTLADRIFADNLDLDQPRHVRRVEFARTAVRIGFTDDCRHNRLDTCDPRSDSAAHLEWTIRGHRGAVRCAVTLTSLRPPCIQSIHLADKTFQAAGRLPEGEPLTPESRAGSL